MYDTKGRGGGYKVMMALKIIDEVVPYILSSSDIIHRAARAYAWYIYLCRVGRKPGVKTDNYREWDNEDLRKIAEALVDYAKDLIEAFV